jgi:hypothetical protein
VANSFPARSTGTQVLVLAGTIVTSAILLWMHQMRVHAEPHGLARIFYFLFAYADYSGALCALLVILGAALIARVVPESGVLRWAGSHPLGIAAVTAIFLALGTLVAYHNHPLSMDEYAAYFQSQVFAAGHLSGNFPPQLLDWLVPRGFQDYFLNVSRTNGDVAETYWPGFSLLLAPFAWLDIPWACNPIVSALTLIVIHRVALVVFDSLEAAGLALLLSVASPEFFADGISYYSMPAHLLANSLFALLLIHPTPRRAFAAGVIGGLALSLHNPVPHILFAAPWLIWIATTPGRVRLLSSLAAGYLPFSILLGWGWFVFSAQLLQDRSIDVASTSLLFRLHRLLSIFALPNSSVLLARLIGVAKLWIWAVPGLLILAGVGAVRERRNTACMLLAISATLTLLGYFFVPVDQGHGWGYRYFRSAWVALPILATAALYRPLRQSVVSRDTQDEKSPAFEDYPTKSYITACILLTLIFGTGWRAWQIYAFVADDLQQLPHYTVSERQVVVINDSHSFYGADLVQNDPWLRGNVVRMYSHGAAADAKMMAQHCPTLRRVYADQYGTVWSESSQPRGSSPAAAGLCAPTIRAASE